VLFVYLRRTCLHFVDLIHALPTRGGKYPIHASRGSFASREENLGEMHLFRGSLHSCIWEIFYAWSLVVILCRWCRALLPHLEESAILEHFISVVLSCCPCLRGPRFFSLKWSLLGFCLPFDHLFEFFNHFVSFSLFSKLVTYVCCQCTHQGGDWGPERPRTGGWSLLIVMSDWQRGVGWLLAEYCRCRLRLDLRWCRSRAGAKGLCLAGRPRSGETSRVGSRDLVASGVKCKPHGGKKSKTKFWTWASAG
jgi:hypothetical protein